MFHSKCSFRYTCRLIVSSHHAFTTIFVCPIFLYILCHFQFLTLFNESKVKREKNEKRSEQRKLHNKQKRKHFKHANGARSEARSGARSDARSETRSGAGSEARSGKYARSYFQVRLRLILWQLFSATIYPVFLVEQVQKAFTKQARNTKSRSKQVLLFIQFSSLNRSKSTLNRSKTCVKQAKNEILSL